MKVPTKQQLRDEIEQLKEDLFTLIEECDQNELLFPILVRNKWYYVRKLNLEAEKELFRYAYGQEPKEFKGIDHYIQPSN